MTDSACRIFLLRDEVPPTDDLDVLGLLSFGGFPEDTVVLCRRTVAGLAVDARFSPGGSVGVGLEIVVCRELAHVAAIAGGVEGVRRVFPVDLLRRFTAQEVADAAGSGVEPLSS
ncbi:MAG: hypothetical protein WAN11_18035 [Syntrophobacteraceae bacterium]